MPFSIITGAAASGKTEYVFNNLIASSINNPEKMHIVITPEQGSYLAEKRLIHMHPNKVLFNIDVLSFNRLAYIIFEDAEVNSPTIINETGLSMLLRRSIMGQEKNLKLYGNSIDKPGFINKLKVIISELTTYGITTDMLKDAYENTDSDALKAKLHDLSVIITSYEALKDKNHIISEELLSKAYSYIEKTSIFDNAEIILDGFTGFTPVQYKLISEIIKRASNVQVTLTISQDQEGSLFNAPLEHELFAPIKTTAIKLQKMAEEIGVKTSVCFIGDNPSDDVQKESALLHLSKNFLRSTKSSKMPITPCFPIEVYSCLNPKLQMELVIHKINELVKHEGYYYRDFAVVSDNIDNSFYLIKNAFNVAGIPCFIDSKIDESSHPLSVFLLSALEVLQKNFSYETIFRFLKSGFANIDLDELDILENYIIATGIKGREAWSNDFTVDSYYRHKNLDLSIINHYRKIAIEPLLKLKDSYDHSKTCSDFVYALKELFISCKIEEKLNTHIEEFDKTGEKVMSIEYAQIYDGVIRIFDELDSILGNVKRFSAKKMHEILKSGISELKISSVPPTIDEVHIGDVRRSMRGYVKVMFFIDFNDGIVPKASAGGGIFSDNDREVLASQNNIEIAPTSKQTTFDERYYLYDIISSPTKKLYICDTKISENGSTNHRSIYFNYICELFDGLKVQNFEGLKPHEVITSNEALTVFARTINVNPSEAKLLYSKLLNYIDKDKLDKIVSGASYCYSGNRIDKEIASELYHGLKQVSVSRLENMASCQYMHFLNYGMGLKERVLYEFSKQERGSFYHKAIEIAFTKIRDEKIDILSSDAEQISEIVNYSVNESINEFTKVNIENLESYDYLLSTWKNVLRRSLLAANEKMVEGFVPTEFEKSFDFKPPISDEKYAAMMHGIVDRYDTRVHDGKTYIGIVDYKTYVKKLDIRLLEEGIQLQLFTYLNALVNLAKESGAEALPGYVSYFEIKDKKKTGLIPGDEVSETKAFDYEGKFSEVVKNKGISESLFNEYFDITNKNIERLTKDIIDGEISINPYERGQDKGCAFCPYKAICGFDIRNNGMKYREL